MNPTGGQVLLSNGGVLQSVSSADDSLRALRAGSNTHWEQLLTRLERPCLVLAWRILNDADLAADAVQEGFLRAYRARDSVREDQQIERWIVAIVANVARDVLKTTLRRERKLKQLPPAQGQPCGLAEENEERLRNALGQLDEQARVIFLLVHQEGFSYQEVASEFGCAVGTVKSKLHRARLALREMLCGRSTP